MSTCLHGYQVMNASPVCHACSEYGDSNLSVTTTVLNEVQQISKFQTSLQLHFITTVATAHPTAAKREHTAPLYPPTHTYTSFFFGKFYLFSLIFLPFTFPPPGNMKSLREKSKPQIAPSTGSYRNLSVDGVARHEIWEDVKGKEIYICIVTIKGNIHTYTFLQKQGHSLSSTET
jgi:hypothetical protein